ncbi:MATE family efflux transporter [Evtepia sp.]|uniref:MATE family efflux transporter n=1 Tax=Evtepia sp. TaxID=2773933 RepID=UPI003F152402
MSSQPQPAKENIMGTMPIPKLLITMSGPMMISMLVQALYNVVDSMFVSRISEAALTAVSLAYPVQNLMIAVATGTGVGINALLSRNLGEKNFAQANRVASNTIFLGVVSSLAVALLGIVGTRFYFTVQISDPEIIQLGCDYLFWIMVLSIGCFGQVLLSRLLQSTGKTVYSMVIQLVGAVLNIILDPILIFGLLGCPALGVAGAAIATVISQFVGLGLGIYYNWRKNPEIRITLAGMRPNLPVISRIYSVGLPSILMQAVPSVLIFGLNQILVSFSETAAAVYGVWFKLQGFAFLPIIGMNNGVVPIVAYNYGARKPDRIVRTVKLAVQVALCIMAVAIALFQLAPDKLLGFFRASPDMLTIGVPALRTMSLCFIVGGFTIVASSFLQALGKGLLSMSIAVFRQLLLVLPLAWLFSLSGSLNLVWFAFPVAEVLAGLLTAYYIYRIYHRVIRPLADVDFKF